MAEFKQLERAYRTALEASLRELQVSENSVQGVNQQGFGEASQSYGFAESGTNIDAAEAACLGYQIGRPEDLHQKLEFVLRQMRQLTDETEEFDAYANRILADVKSVI
ncbi:MAG: hypothetical protein APF80_01995 [Alphaproteobacteria bacterium BRH_c36]|nr:MAG: hypothetical protein APF80_01995 [Alphaproteobacteria bacterium BRH_c36]